MRLRAQAPAKVNLSLFLGEPRPDGRHELVTVFQSLSLADDVELAVEGDADEVICPGVEGENLAARALAGLRARGWDGPPVRITIAKRIPVAAGMAGGSADAAAALRLATFVSPGPAEEVAATLGADVPSQLVPGLSIGTGAGELVEPFPPLEEHAFAVVPFVERLSTADVYREADRLGLGRPVEALSAAYRALAAAMVPGGRLPSELVLNDLQPAALSLCPSIDPALEALRSMGADHAIVSGSGPTAVGIWWGAQAPARAGDACSRLAARFPGTVPAVPVTSEFARPEPA